MIRPIYFTKVFFFALLFLLEGCKKDIQVNCSETAIKTVYTSKMTANDIVGYSHYLLLSPYSDNCFTELSFSSLAKNYVDTCRSPGPIRIVSFLSSVEEIDFEGNEPDFEKLKDYEVLSFEIDVSKAKGRISKVYFTKNKMGKAFKVSDSLLVETKY